MSQFNPNWTHSTRIGTFRKWILYASNVTNTKCQCLIARHQDVRIFRKIHSLTIGLECYVVCIPFVSPNIFVRLLSFVAVGNFHVKICIQRNNSTKQIAANLSMYFRWYVLRSIGMYSVNLRNCNSSLYIKTLSLFCLTLRTFKTLMKMSEKHVEGIVSNSNVDGQELSFCFVNLFYSLEKPFFFFCIVVIFVFILFYFHCGDKPEQIKLTEINASELTRNQTHSINKSPTKQAICSAINRISYRQTSRQIEATFILHTYSRVYQISRFIIVILHLVWTWNLLFCLRRRTCADAIQFDWFGHNNDSNNKTQAQITCLLPSEMCYY